MRKPWDIGPKFTANTRNSQPHTHLSRFQTANGKGSLLTVQQKMNVKQTPLKSEESNFYNEWSC